MRETVKAKSLAAYSSCAIGHSQGLASAACLSFIRFSLRAIWAIFRQGLREQEASGLQSLLRGTDGRLRQSSMVALRGRPSAYLQSHCLGAAANIVNSESTVVCSGGPALQLLKRLKGGAKRFEGVEARPLPIPFASHSHELTPAMFRLLDELRCQGFSGRRVKAKLRVYPFTPGLNARRRGPLDLWRIVVARQLTALMDFPSVVEQAAAEVCVTHAIDMGPTDSSVAARLLAGSGHVFPVLPLVAAASWPAAPTAPAVPATPAAGPAPGAPLLARICAVAREVLGLPGLLPGTSLARVGATSQRLGALRGRLQELVPECTGRLPAAGFFAARTLAAVADLVTSAGGGAAPGGAGAPSGAGAAVQAATEQQQLPPLVHVSVYANRGTTYPLSFGQEQMLRVQATNPTCTAYNASASVWIAGGASPERVRACLQAVIARHEVFSGLAQLSPPGLRLLAATPSVAVMRVPDEAAALARLGEMGRAPFHLTEEPSLRAEVLCAPGGLLLLALWVHHMNFDILSQGVLHGELLALLSSREPPSRAATRLPELPVQYVDFSIWSRRCAAKGLWDAAAVLAKLAPHAARALDLPLDRPRPRQWTFQGDRVVTRLPQNLELPHEGVTPFVAHLAAFFVLLWKSSGQEAAVVGVPYHGRDLASLQPLCGYFINMLPVVGQATARTTVAGAISQTRERWQNALEHACVPFLQVVDSLGKQHASDHSRNPVFQAMLNYRAETVKPLQDKRFRIQQVHQLEGHMDLDVQIDPAESGVTVSVNYCTSLFEPRTAERFAAQYLAALRAISLEEWKHIQTWRIPSAPRLLEDIQEAKPISLEYSARKLTPLLAEVQQPFVVGGPTGLQVLY